MTIVRIPPHEEKSTHTRQVTSDAVHEAMIDSINVPINDRFQIITQYAPECLIADPVYLGIDRFSDVIVIQITLNVGRSLELKRALYRRIVDLLAEKAGVRPQDVIINLLEVPKENWSFGNGEAQYVAE